MVLEHLRSAFLVLSSIPLSKKTRSILFLEKVRVLTPMVSLAS